MPEVLFWKSPWLAVINLWSFIIELHLYCYCNLKWCATHFHLTFLHTQDAIAANSYLCEENVIARGSVSEGFAASDHIISRELFIGGQVTIANWLDFSLDNLYFIYNYARLSCCPMWNNSLDFSGVPEQRGFLWRSIWYFKGGS